VTVRQLRYFAVLGEELNYRRDEPSPLLEAIEY
jgi:hypothetical protein